MPWYLLIFWKEWFVIFIFFHKYFIIIRGDHPFTTEIVYLWDDKKGTVPNGISYGFQEEEST